MYRPDSGSLGVHPSVTSTHLSAGLPPRHPPEDSVTSDSRPHLFLTPPSPLGVSISGPLFCCSWGHVSLGCQHPRLSLSISFSVPCIFPFWSAIYGSLWLMACVGV